MTTAATADAQGALISSATGKPYEAHELTVLAAFRWAMLELGIPSHFECAEACRCSDPALADEVEGKARELVALWETHAIAAGVTTI